MAGGIFVEVAYLRLGPGKDLGMASDLDPGKDLGMASDLDPGKDLGMASDLDPGKDLGTISEEYYSMILFLAILHNL